MDIIQLGTQLLSDKLDLQLDSVGGLGGLMGAAKPFL